MPGGPLGGAVGDQDGDGEVGLAVGIAAAGVPLERAPLPDFGVGVLDADPARSASCGRTFLIARPIVEDPTL
ncbi:hypothetical protein AB0N06_07855 [Streptomyces sp. NPDC051020]|uniref:hypothetical protein n=1 Tax=Streptomyces sp. NPDC051020 TaxID=3155409 RepID=UPI0034382E05